MLLNQYHLLRPVTQNKVSCQPWHFTLIYLSLSQLKERCMVHTQTTTTTKTTTTITTTTLLMCLDKIAQGEILYSLRMPKS